MLDWRGREAMKKSIQVSALLFCGSIFFTGLATSAGAATIGFEDLSSNIGADIASVDQYYAGLDWGQPDTAAHWEIRDTDPFTGSQGSDIWLRGSATTDQNFAKITSMLSFNSFMLFSSMDLRSRAYDSAKIGSTDTDGDGVDDRWLNTITLQFNVENKGNLVVDVQLSPYDWETFTLADLNDIGFTNTTYSDSPDELLATDQIRAIKFIGTAQSTPNLDYQDRFALDNLDVSPVPIPAAMWLLGSGFAGIVGIRRRRKEK